MEIITEADIEFIRQTQAKRDNCAIGTALLKYNNERYAMSNKMLKDDDPTAHAAVVLTRSMRAMIRKGQSFRLLLSEKPCPMCVSAIYQANIHDLRYLDDNNTIRKIELNTNNIYLWYEEIHTNQEK